MEGTMSKNEVLEKMATDIYNIKKRKIKFVG